MTFSRNSSELKSKSLIFPRMNRSSSFSNSLSQQQIEQQEVGMAMHGRKEFKRQPSQFSRISRG